ncbi:hypothetical protein OHS58_03765 [Amycolatopsis sp. NBC_00348]
MSSVGRFEPSAGYYPDGVTPGQRISAEGSVSERSFEVDNLGGDAR